MTDPRFYNNKGPFTLSQLAEIGECEITRGDPSTLIHDVAPLNLADSKCISVFHNKKYFEMLGSSKTGACILDEQSIQKAPNDSALLVSKYPTKSYALIAATFYPIEKQKPGIHPTAIVHESVKLGNNVYIGPYVIIEENVQIGDEVQIGAHSVIEKGVSIQEYTVIRTHVMISHALVGKYVHIKSGARIGQRGFGFFMDPSGQGNHLPVPQLGRVILHDFVEIGSNSTVDRGSGDDTIIGYGTRIDNLVQIAHNVHFGTGCVMVAQSGVAGSTKFGDYVAAGGQAGIADHLKIGSGAQLGAQCGIMSDIEPREIVMGSPAAPVKTFFRQQAMLKKLTKDDRKK